MASAKATRLPDYVPDTITDKAVHDFLHHYYDVSNDGQAHDDYAEFYTKDGEFIFNDKKAKGRPDILALRKAIWSHIPDRDHTPVQIYTHGNDQLDLMVHGDVKYKHHHGHETGGDWAARIKLAKEDGAYKLQLYHVIVDSAHHH